MKKVIAISSSGRQKNTYQLIQSAAPLLKEAGISLQIIHLSNYVIQDCKGCEACILSDRCPIKDDVIGILEKLGQADGIILTSPVYMAGVSGQLKRFIDRTCKWYHRPELVKKPVLLMTTTAGGYADEVLDYMEKVATFWGMHLCGRVKRNVKTWDEAVSRKELKFFIKAVEEGEETEWIPTKDQVIAFQVQKTLAMNILPRDRKYWIEHGYDVQVYYEENDVPFYLKWMGNSFYSFFSRIIKKKSS